MFLFREKIDLESLTPSIFIILDFITSMNILVIAA